MKRLIAVIAVGLALTGCGVGNSINSTFTGKPIEQDMGKGVTCYTYTSSQGGAAMSCLVRP